MAWRNQALKSGKLRSLRRLQNRIKTSKRLHNPRLSVVARCSLKSAFSNTVMRHSVRTIPTVSHLLKPHGFLFRLRLGMMFRSLFNGARLPSLNVSSVHSNLLAWSEALGEEVNDVSRRNAVCDPYLLAIVLSLPVGRLVAHKNWPIHWSAYYRTLTESLLRYANRLIVKIRNYWRICQMNLCGSSGVGWRYVVSCIPHCLTHGERVPGMFCPGWTSGSKYIPFTL